MCPSMGFDNDLQQQIITFDTISIRLWVGSFCSICNLFSKISSEQFKQIQSFMSFFLTIRYSSIRHWKPFIWSDFVGIQCVGSFSYGLILLGLNVVVVFHLVWSSRGGFLAPSPDPPSTHWLPLHHDTARVEDRLRHKTNSRGSTQPSTTNQLGEWVGRSRPGLILG